jgi:hypothetical protein
VSSGAERASSGLVAAVAASTLAVVALVGTRALVFGSVEGRWTYPYVAPWRLTTLLATVAFAVAAAAAVAVALRLVDGNPPAAVASAVVGVTGIQFALWRLYPWSLDAIVRSDNANSYFTAAGLHGPLDLLRRYDVLAPTLPFHAVGNMPGKILLYQALRALTSSPGAMAAAVFLLGNLVGALIYLVAREILDDRAAAVAAMAVYLLAPGRLVFAPILNGVSVLPVALALLAWLRWLRGGGFWTAASTGAAVLATLLFDPLPLALGLVFLAAPLALPGDRATLLRRAATGSAIALAALVACHLLLVAALSFDTVRQLRFVLSEAAGFNATRARPYGVWLAVNPLEFLVSLGAATVAACAWGAWRRPAPRDPATWTLVAGLATLLVLDLLGRNRGEVSRLWIFLAVPFALSAGAFLSRGGRAPVLFAAAALALQGATMLLTVGFVMP